MQYKRRCPSRLSSSERPSPPTAETLSHNAPPPPPAPVSSLPTMMTLLCLRAPGERWCWAPRTRGVRPSWSWGDRLVSLRTTSLRFIHPRSRGRCQNAPPLEGSVISPVGGAHVWLRCSSVQGPWDGFPVVAAVSKVAVNVGVHAPLSPLVCMTRTWRC